MNDHRPGNPEVDALIAAADQEQAEYWKIAVVNKAENTVADIRQTDLAAAQKAARRRWSAAKGLLTKAQKDGDAARIAAAREREITTYREFDAISATVIDEMHGIVQAGLDRTGHLLDQLDRANTARDAVLDALRRPI